MPVSSNRLENFLYAHNFRVSKLGLFVCAFITYAIAMVSNVMYILYNKYSKLNLDILRDFQVSVYERNVLYSQIYTK